MKHGTHTVAALLATLLICTTLFASSNAVAPVAFPTHAASSIAPMAPVAEASIFASETWVDDNYTLALTPGFGIDHFATIQEAINVTASAGIVHVAAGTYIEKLQIARSMELLGAGSGVVTINASTLAGSVIHSNVGGVTISGVTVIGNATAFGLKIEGMMGSPTGTFAQTITISDVSVQGAVLGGIDLIGIDGASITNVYATGSTAGQGIGLTDCKNITMAGINTSGNNMAGIRLTADGTYFPGGIDQITLGAGNTIVEIFAEVYSEFKAGLTVTNLHFDASGLIYRVLTPGNNVIAYSRDLASSAARIVAFANPALPSGAIANINSENYYVVGGLRIQDAISVALPGAVYVIEPRTYNETVTINKDVDFAPVPYTPVAPPVVGIPGLVIRDLVINNTNGFTSHSPVKITGSLTFIKGNLNTVLTTFVELDANASIVGEKNDGTGQAMIMGDVHAMRTIDGTVVTGSTFGNMGFAVSNIHNNVSQMLVLRRTGPGAVVTVGPNSGIKRSWWISGMNALAAPMTVTATWLANDYNPVSIKGILIQSADQVAWNVMTTQATMASLTVTDATSAYGFFTIGDPDAPLPVELTAFSASANGKKVTLNWSTATERNNFGFDVERRPVGGTWEKAAFVEGAGTSNTPREYSYTDAVTAGRFEYRLKQTDRNGAFEYSKTIEAAVAFAAEDYIVSQNYPNPFNPTTNIRFAVKTAQHAVVKIFNAIGQEVRTLFNETAQPETMYSLTFDASGLPSGSYYYLLRTADRSEVKRMLLVK